MTELKWELREKKYDERAKKVAYKKKIYDEGTK